jgi:hypothetical protein
MEEKITFFKWFNNIGGIIPLYIDLANFDCLEFKNLTDSSLKNRASEIKEKYNYKFENL